MDKLLDGKNRRIVGLLSQASTTTGYNAEPHFGKDGVGEQSSTPDFFSKELVSMDTTEVIMMSIIALLFLLLILCVGGHR